MNITRFDPFRELTQFNPFRDTENWFDRFALRPVLREFGGEPQIRMDVKELNEEYRVKAEIPGVKKDDIHVSVDGNRVSISAEVKKEHEEKEGERLIRAERSYGMTSRIFSLDNEVDANNVKAKYTDGVLEISLPKKAGAVTKEIRIS